jgi:transcriptional regulator with XRE-family HTH domain
MPKSHKGALSQYVRWIMQEKNLSRRDVKLRSGGQITDSYVSGIVNGTATNLSIKKLKALAQGLRVTERELVDTAHGLSYASSAETERDQSHNLIVFRPKKQDGHRYRYR